VSDPHPPISPLLECVNRLSRHLGDLREGQAQINRILARNLEANTRALDANTRALKALRAEIGELRRDVCDLGAEQASLAMQANEAVMRAAQVDRRLDDRDGGQTPAGSA
jgi:chromosome segregation ATPase